MELTDDFTIVKGRHSLLIQNLYGNCRFANIANYQAGVAQAYSLGYSNTQNPLEAAKFSSGSTAHTPVISGVPPRHSP